MKKKLKSVLLSLNCRQKWWGSSPSIFVPSLLPPIRGNQGYDPTETRSLEGRQFGHGKTTNSLHFQDMKLKT